jgi:hypothetical protein
MSRAASTLLGAGIGGFLLWLAAQLGRHTTGSYWAACGIVAGAGLVVGMSQLRGRDGHPPATFTLAFLPVLIVAGWVLLAMQPDGNWFRNHVLAWSGDIHVRGIVEDLGTWVGVLSFGIGLVFGFALEPATLRRRRREPAVATVPAGTARADTVAPAADGAAPARTVPAETMAPTMAPNRPVTTDDARAADEPIAAERREVTDDGTVAGRQESQHVH